ncbi:alpha/beta hydrolase [Sphingopyxis granuli]|uniref:alpha/beta fold hydrolase n=1 Tax=Sphingopyxis granuli TaxID=267128 RepID=UPI001F53D7E8|nr:alpha/beta hydrolase [Sphingopyxis granuli]UNK80066.1 alpha/beta hydrolase [Sphingopyxis granuli]
MATITLNRTQHYYEDTGGEGPTILFIHGLFFDGRMFADQITGLKDRYRCVSLDWRSQGRSEVAPFGHDVDGLVNDARALIEALDLAPCHVVGVSVGGVIAIRLAAQYPDLISAAVGIGSSAKCETIETLVRYEDLFARYSGDGPESVIGELMPLIFGKRFNEAPEMAAARDSWRAHICGNNGMAVGRAAAPILRRVDISHMLEYVRCPALFVVGDEDFVNGIDKARHIVAGIPSAQIAVMPGVGHTPPLEAPKDLADILANFFDSLWDQPR